MKGLIYRDLQINKKCFILSFVFLLYLFNLLLTEAVMVDNDMLLMINLYTLADLIAAVKKSVNVKFKKARI